MADQPTYVSRVRIERVAGPLRLAYLPAEPEPVRFGTHGPVAAHYGETQGRGFVLRRIRARYVVPAPGEHAEVVDRVHRIHKEHCPVYRSIRRAIDATRRLASGGLRSSVQS